MCMFQLFCDLPQTWWAAALVWAPLTLSSDCHSVNPSVQAERQELPSGWANSTAMIKTLYQPWRRWKPGFILWLTCEQTCGICCASLNSGCGSGSSSSWRSSLGITTTGFLYSPKAAARRKFGGPCAQNTCAWWENSTKQLYVHVETFLKSCTYIWEIWDLDDAFKELHFSGSVEELC